jgi:exosortase
MNHQATANDTSIDESFSQDVRSSWNALPNKTFFFVLLVAWLALFQFFGNATFGYIDTPSLFKWLFEAYNAKSTVTDDSHGNLVPIVVLVLLWWKRRELLAQPMRVWWPGLLMVGGAVLLHMVGYMVQQPKLSVLALFAGIYGLMGLAWGPAWLKAVFFPYFLFAFSVPLGSMTEPITFPLRLMVSHIVAFIGQHVLGIDVVSEGTRLLKMPYQYEYEVAAACSGIRSLVAIAAIAVVYGFTTFRSNWKRILMVFSAVPLAIIGNTFRMLAIIVAAEVNGQEAGNAVHESAFWSMLPYIPAILGVLLLGRWLEGKTPGTQKQSAPPKTTGQTT